VLLRCRELNLTTSLDTNNDATGQWGAVDGLWDQILPLVDVFMPNELEAIAIADVPLEGVEGGEQRDSDGEPNAKRLRKDGYGVWREGEGERSPLERDNSTVMVHQLPRGCVHQDLIDHFETTCGKVLDVKIIADRANPRVVRSKGVAYVEFEDIEGVDKAVAMNGQKCVAAEEGRKAPLIITATADVESRRIALTEKAMQATFPKDPTALSGRLAVAMERLTRQTKNGAGLVVITRGSAGCVIADGRPYKKRNNLQQEEANARDTRELAPGFWRDNSVDAPGSAETTLRIPADRVSAVFGDDGITKQSIESQSSCTMVEQEGEEAAPFKDYVVKGSTRSQVEQAITMVHALVAPGTNRRAADNAARYVDRFIM
jgi:hypothetical protein